MDLRGLIAKVAWHDIVDGSEVARRAKTRRQVQDAILVESRRRCCICFGLDRDFGRKKGQIAHLDGNPANATASNLVFLCWDHHDEFDSRSSQSKNLTRGEVRRFKDELSEHIRAAFGQEREGQQIEAKDFPTSLPAVHGSEGSQNAKASETRSEPPSHWVLRYQFEHSSPASLGKFGKDSRQLMVMEKNNCSRFFRDGIDNSWIFEMPEHLRETIAHTGVDLLASFIESGGGASVYARANGDLSVVTETFTEDDRVDASWETLKAHRTRPSFAGFAPDGSVLMTGDEAGELLIWDWPARRKTHRLPSLVGPVETAYLNYGIDRVVVTGRNGSFEIFELSTSRALASGSARVKGDGAQVHFSLDPAYLVAHDAADRFDALETATLKVAPEKLWPLIWVNMKSDAKERVLAVWTVTGAVLAAIREPSEKIERDAFETLSPPGRRVSDYEVSSDGERIAIMVERRSLLVWERIRPRK